MRSSDADVFIPINETIGAQHSLRVETDRMSLYGFMSDFSLYLFIAIGIYFGIDRWAAGQGAHQEFQMIMIGLGMISIIWILVDRNRAKIAYVFVKIKRLRLKWIIAVSNVLVTVGLYLGYVLSGKLTFAFTKAVFVVSVWEQLIFSITIPYLIVRTLQVVFKFKDFNVFAASIATVISGVLFGLVHTYAYGGDWGVIGWLILIGIGLHSFGYYFPSTSMVVHTIINFSAAGGTILCL